MKKLATYWRACWSCLAGVSEDCPPGATVVMGPASRAMQQICKRVESTNLEDTVEKSKINLQCNALGNYGPCQSCNATNL